MRYILRVVTLLEASDVTNNSRHLGRHLGFFQELEIRLKSGELFFFLFLFLCLDNCLVIPTLPSFIRTHFKTLRLVCVISSFFIKPLCSFYNYPARLNYLCCQIFFPVAFKFVNSFILV